MLTRGDPPDPPAGNTVLTLGGHPPDPPAGNPLRGRGRRAAGDGDRGAAGRRVAGVRVRPGPRPVRRGHEVDVYAAAGSRIPGVG